MFGPEYCAAVCSVSRSRLLFNFVHVRVEAADDNGLAVATAVEQIGCFKNMKLPISWLHILLSCQTLPLKVVHCSLRQLAYAVDGGGKEAAYQPVCNMRSEWECLREREKTFRQ